MAKRRQEDGRPHKFTVAQVEAALKESRGFKSVASRKLGCTIGTVINYCRRHPKLQEVLDHIQEERLDRSEVSLDHLMFPPTIQDKDSPDYGKPMWKPDKEAIMFFLRTIGKKRGYVEREELNIKQDIHYEIELPEDFPTEDYDDPDIKQNERDADSGGAKAASQDNK